MTVVVAATSQTLGRLRRPARVRLRVVRRPLAKVAPQGRATPGFQPISFINLARAYLRQRYDRIRRLRWRPPPLTIPTTAIERVEQTSKGRISGPEMVRGTVSGGGSG